MAQRISYLDICKGLTIWLVILGHVLQYTYPIKGMFMYDPIWQFIYSFHMPVFMVISGYLTYSSLNKPFLSFVSKNFRHLLLPSIIVAALFYTCKYIICNENIFTFTSLKQWTISVLISHWYLRCLFLCLLLAYLCKAIFRKLILAAILSSTVLCLISYFNWFNVNFLMPFFWIGCIAKQFIKKEKTIFSKWNILIFIILFAILYVGWNGKRTIYFTKPMFFEYIDGQYDLDLKNIWIYIQRLMLGFIGSILLIALSRYLSKYNNKIIDFIKRLGCHTMGIYIVQIYSLEVLLPVLKIKFSFPQFHYMAIILSIVELFVCLYLILFTNKILIYFSNIKKKLLRVS